MIPQKRDVSLPTEFFSQRGLGPTHKKLLVFMNEARAFGINVYGFSIDAESYSLLRAELRPGSERDGCLTFNSCNGVCRVTVGSNK